MSNPPINVDGGYLDQPLLPARRLHNFVYCKRLFYYQWVENLFEDNADTILGKLVHRNVDKPSRLSKYDDLELPEGRSIRSLKLQSNKYGLIGVVDLILGDSEGAHVVDYKKGSALRSDDGSLEVKDSDAVQVVAHAMILSDNGQKPVKAFVYYSADKRKLEIPLNEQAYKNVRNLIQDAKLLAKSNVCPEPLVNDVRCLYCSAYSFCMPGESHWWSNQKNNIKQSDQLSFSFISNPSEDTRCLDSEFLPMSESKRTPRPKNDDGEILIVQKPGSQIGIRGNQITISNRREVITKHAINQVNSIYIYGAVQLTAQASQACLQHEISVSYFSPAGRFIGALQGLCPSGIDARRGQYRIYDNASMRLFFSCKFIRAKIHNQRVLLMRNGNPSKTTLHTLASFRDRVEKSLSITELLGIEGAAAAIYFENFQTMLKGISAESFDFKNRNRRPPRDPINALLSMGYSMLAKEITGICHTVGLDPFLGFLHQPRYGRPALALDVMEEFRPLIADSVAISLINRNEVNKSDFVETASGTFLNDEGRRAFWESWFRRMDTEIKHPEFGYKMSYRRMLEVQVRQLWRVFRGEAKTYHAFTTR